MRMICYNESDFSSEEVEISEEFFNLSSEIFAQFGNCSDDLIISSDKKSLTFCVFLGDSRMESELGLRKYKVSITPILDKDEIRNTKINYLK